MRVAVVVLFVASILTFVFTTEYIVVEDFFDELRIDAENMKKSVSDGIISEDEAFDIVKEVNSPYVKVIYDIYHQQITEGNIIPTVISNLDHIAHLHAAGHPGRHELHLGENDYRVIVNALDKAGYSGAMGLEYFPTLDPIESLKQTRQLLLNK